MKNLKVLSLLFLMVFILSACGKEDEGNDSDSLTDKLKAQGITFQVQQDAGGSSYTGYAIDVLNINCAQKSKATDFRRMELLQAYVDGIQGKDNVKLNGKRYYASSISTAVQQAMSYIQYQIQMTGFNNTSNGQCPQSIIGQVQLQRF